MGILSRRARAGEVQECGNVQLEDMSEKAPLCQGAFSNTSIWTSMTVTLSENGLTHWSEIWALGVYDYIYVDTTEAGTYTIYVENSERMR
jgi:hypothetical protein